MKISISELRLELLDDYLAFFHDICENDPWLNTENNPWWGICDCGFYDDTRTEEERNNAPNAVDENRSMRAETIRSGKAGGLLAYADGKVVAGAILAQRKTIRTSQASLDL